METQIKQADFDQFFILLRKATRLAHQNHMDTNRISLITKKAKKELRKSPKKRNIPQIKHMFNLIFKEIYTFQAYMVWDEKMVNTQNMLKRF